MTGASRPLVWSVGIHAGLVAALACVTGAATLLFGSLSPCTASAIDCRVNGGAAILVPGLAATAIFGLAAASLARATQQLRRGRAPSRMAAAPEGLVVLTALGGVAFFNQQRGLAFLISIPCALAALHSLLTGVVLLAQRTDFQGGSSEPTGG